MKSKINYVLPILLFWIIGTNENYAQDDWLQKFPTEATPPNLLHSMAYIGSDKVVIFGGFNSNGPGNETRVYDLSDNTWTWKDPAVSPPERYNARLAYIGADKVLLTGGYSNFQAESYHTDTWVYDLSDNTWTNMDPPLTPGIFDIAGTGMDYIGDDHVLLIGGGATWMYDLSNNAWTLKIAGGSPPYFQGDNASYIGDDKILLAGEGAGYYGTVDTWIYDLSDNVWTMKSPVSGPSWRYYTGTAYLGDDRVLLYGGHILIDDYYDLGNDTWMYDLSEDTWILLSTSTTPAVTNSMAMDHIGNNKVLLNGGIAGNSFELQWALGDTWLFTGSGQLCGQELCNGEDDDCDGEIDESVTTSYFLDNDNDGFGDPNQSVQSCEPLSGYVTNGTDCDDLHGNVHPDANEVVDGLDNDCDGLIDEGSSTLSVTAGECATVYFGYSSGECTTLDAVATGGSTPYTYNWSNGETSSSITVCPVATTNYTVTVTDHNGTSAHAMVTVQVVDVRCGSNNSKVSVCHLNPGNSSPLTLCVAPSAVSAHLAHGDQLGSCDIVDPCGEEQNSAMMIMQEPINPIASNSSLASKNLNDLNLSEDWTIYPNPAVDQLYIEKSENKERIEIYLLDISGKAIRHLTLQNDTGQIETSEIADGIYFLKIISPREHKMVNISILH